MDDVAVIGPDSLDLEEYARLQRESFAEVLAGTGMDYFLRPEYYAWKYRPPAGPARIAIVTDGGRLVAANAMFAVEVADDARRTLAWQSCDTATHPSARGRGLFSRCIAALRESLGEDSIFFGFPNRSSLGGFAKLGWQVQSDVAVFARPLAGGSTRRFGGVEPFAADGIDAFAAAFSSRRGPAVLRTDAYLRWRYASHPLNRYEMFVLRDRGAVAGVVVLRRATVRGRDVAAVMEAAALEPRGTRRLLAFAAAWAAERGVRTAVAMGTAVGTLDALRAGFVPVPRFALPKRQVLMGAARGTGAQALWARPWNVHLGDWDAF